MGFRDEYLWTNRTYAEWSLERTVEGRLKDLQDTLRSQLRQARGELTGAFRSELDRVGEHLCGQARNASEAIVNSLESGFSVVISSIEGLSSYLGGELAEITWAVDQLHETTKEILRVLLESLDNESRQYFEQGVQAYRANELEIAKERFTKALERNMTNDFAYQYLGFISVDGLFAIERDRPA